MVQVWYKLGGRNRVSPGRRGAGQIPASAVLRSLDFILTTQRSHRRVLSFLGLL